MQRPSFSSSQTGKARRLAKIFSQDSGKTLILPIDDSLIFGPVGGLEDISSKLPRLVKNPPNAILAFIGAFRAHAATLSNTAWIVNLTGSTTRSQHTLKVLVATVEQAVQVGADAVAIHVNVSSRHEHEMLRTLGLVAHDCEAYGMPLLAIMYPRSESDSGDNNYEDLKEQERKKYAELVAHCARIAVDVGADIIKTKYSGDPDSFRTVVNACSPTPVITAGGPALPIREMLRAGFEIMSAGAAGLSFGRNLFNRPNPERYVKALQAIVHAGLYPEQALASAGLKDKKTRNK